MSSPLTFPAFSTALLSGESREELEALFEAYFAEYNPRTITEERAISEMVDAEWRIRRLRNSQFGSNNLSAVEFRRFESHLIRLYDRGLRNLLDRKSVRIEKPRRNTAKPAIGADKPNGIDMHGAPH